MSDLSGEGGTLKEARQWLRSQLTDGVKCPCCEQFAKQYARKLNSGMARWLLRFYRATRSDGNFHHFKIVDRGSGDWTLLRHWGLIERHPNNDPKVKFSGWWRLTQRGRLFAQNVIQVPTYVVLYDGNRLGFEGKEVYVRDALGEHFDYAELMGHPLEEDD